MKRLLDILVSEMAVVLLWADAEDIVIFGRER